MKSLTEIIKGMPKEVLEYLEKNTELAKLAINSHKTNFKTQCFIHIYWFYIIPNSLNNKLSRRTKGERVINKTI